MGYVPSLLTFLLMVVSGWVRRQQLIVIDFLQAENRMLKERIRFTDPERALLARRAKAVDRKALLELETIVSPRYADAVASAAGGAEMGLQQAPWPRSAWNHAQNLGLSLAHGAGESEVGIHADSGGAGEPAAHGGLWYRRQRIEGERNRTGTTARKVHPLVDVSEGALEGICRQRLLQRLTGQ